MPIDDTDLKRLTGDPWGHPVPPTCPRCGYNLTGITLVRCPECGSFLNRRELDQRARDLSADMARLRDVNDIPRYGLWSAIGGFVVIGIGVLVGVDPIGRVLGIFIGIISIGLGLSVFRAVRLPASMLEQLPKPPSFGLGLGAALLGVLLIALSIFMP